MLSRTHIGLILACFVCSLLLWGTALWSQTPFQYADGDTATWIWLLRHGQDIYSTPGGLPMWQSNYPPLFLRLVAALAPSDALILQTGSLIAMAAFTVAMGLIGLTAGVAAGSWRIGILAGLLFGGSLFAAYLAPACIADAPAFCMATVGLTLVSLRVRGWPLLAAVAFATAVMLKHSLVVLPIGVAAWALLRAPRQGVLLVLSSAALVSLCLWKAKLFTPLVLWTWAPWLGKDFVVRAAEFVLPSLPGIAVALLLLRRWDELPERARQVLGPWAGAFCVSLLWTLALGRRGGGGPYVIELLASVAVIGTVAAARGLGRRLYLLHVFVTFCVTSIGVGYLTLVKLPGMREEMAYTQSLLAETPGSVIVETTWYTTVLGRPPVIVPWLSTNLAVRGFWNPAPLLGALQRGEVQRLILEFPLTERGAPSFHAERFLPEVLAAARAHYVLVGRKQGLYIYAPANEVARKQDPPSPTGTAALHTHQATRGIRQ